MQSSTFATSLRDYLRILFHRKWYILFFTMTSLLGFAIYAFVIAVNLYEAHNVFLVHDQNSEPLKMGDNLSPVHVRLNRAIKYIQTTNGVRQTLAGIDRLAHEFQRSPSFLALRAEYLKGRQSSTKTDIELANMVIEDAGRRRNQINKNPIDYRRRTDAFESQLVMARIKLAAGKKDLIRVGRELETVMQRLGVLREAHSTPVSYDPVSSGQDQRFYRLVSEIKNELSVSVRRSQINVSIRCTNPILAQIMVDRIFSEIKTVHQNLIDEEIYSATDMLGFQLEQAQGELKSLRQDLGEIEKTNRKRYRLKMQPITSVVQLSSGEEMKPLVPNGQNPNSQVLDYLYELESKSNVINSEIHALTSGVAALETQLANTPELISVFEHEENILENSLKQTLVDLWVIEADNIAGQSDQHPQMIELRKKIAHIENKLAQVRLMDRSAVRSIPNPKIGELNKELGEKTVLAAELRGKLEIIEALRIKHEKMIADLPSFLTKRQGVIEAIANKSTYIRLLQKKEHNATTTMEVLNSGGGLKFTMPEQTYRPLKPVEPKKALLMFLGLIIGFFFSAAAVFFVEYADHSIKGIEDVRRFLGLPVLGVIPDYTMYEQTTRNRFMVIIGNTSMKRVAMIAVITVLTVLGVWWFVSHRSETLVNEGIWIHGEEVSPDTEPHGERGTPLTDSGMRNGSGLSMLSDQNIQAEDPAQVPVLNNAEVQPDEQPKDNVGVEPQSKSGADVVSHANAASPTVEESAGPPPLPSSQ